MYCRTQSRQNLHRFYGRAQKSWDQFDEYDSPKLCIVMQTSEKTQVHRNNGTPNYQQLKTAVKLHFDQMMRTRNFRVRSDVVERGSVTKSQKERKPVEKKVGECFQWKAHGQCSKGDSCSFSHDIQVFLETVAKVRDKKDDRLLLHPTRRQNRLTARDKNPYSDQAVNRKLIE